MSTITINTDNKYVIKAIKALLKGFDVKIYHYAESDAPVYSPEFVQSIEKGLKEKKIKPEPAAP